jgi:flavin-dependent dehydrogenase
MPDPVAGSTIQTDICVIGGGPAGSALARRLRQLGHSVVVVEKKSFPRTHVGESIVPSVLPLFETLGISGEVERSGFLRPQGAIVRWSGPSEWRRIAVEPGFQVDRARFDEILLAASAEAGALILQPARPHTLSYSNGNWRIAVDYKAARLMIESPFIADATGRAGFLSGSRHRSGEKTLALYAYWQNLPPCGPETRIEAGEHEWYWGAPLPGGEFNATVFLDGSRCRKKIAEVGGLDAFYETLISDSELLAFCLRGSRSGPVRACDATTYADDVPVTSSTIKVGEAAFSIDPLSSQGVQIALGSALHAAAVIHTIIERPQDTDLAIEFYKMRQRESVALHTRAAGKIYREVAQLRPNDFWHSRAVSSDHLEFERLPFRQPTLTVDTEIQLAPGVHLQKVPCIRGDFVEAIPAVVRAGATQPLVFLDGIEIGALMSLIKSPLTVRQVLNTWERQISPKQAEAILTWLWENRVLNQHVS